MQSITINTKKTSSDKIKLDINKVINETTKSLRKDINTMISSFEVFVQQTNDTLTSIESDVNRIKEKLWPNYFYLEAINNATITVNGLGTGELKYTKTPDDDSSWTTETISSGSTFNITLDAGEKCYFVGDITTNNQRPGSVTFVTADSITCGGNVYYVADKNGQLSKVQQCNDMFNGCTGLTTAPELPATTLTTYCYCDMFWGCTGLTTAPKLPATTLEHGCYQSMFRECTGLTTAPELPATTLATACYLAMFEDCTGLTTAPFLPATILLNSCYRGMFWGCTSLTTAPLLQAPTLTNNCYREMFNDCSNLNRVICLATDISATDCTTDWLLNVASTGTFIKDANTTWTTGSDGIPSGWTIENEINQ